MRVLVTGSSGFIGRHVCAELLRHGYTVAGLDVRLPPPELDAASHHRIDLLDRARLIEFVQQLQPEAILHLAARTDLGGRTVADYPANTTGVDNLLAAIEVTPSVRRAICTSSQLVCAVGYRPRSELDYAPSTPYGESKVQTERIWRSRDGAGREWCIVRPTTIWGPGMSDHYLRFFRYLAQGRYAHVGPASQLKSYGFVGNTAYQYRALLTAPAERIHGRTLYLADYQPIMLRDWVEANRRALGAPPVRTLPLPLARFAAGIGDVLNFVGVRRFPFNSFRLRNITTSYTFDLDETERICGALPFDLREGARMTAAWVRHELGGAPASSGERASATVAGGGNSDERR